MRPMQPATAQMQADAMLANDRERRRIARLYDSALRQCLAAIEQRAKAEAAPYLAALAELEAMRPAASVIIPRDLALGAALGEPFGRAPYSRADQARNALLAAFEGETDTSRARLRKLLAAASDATLERAAGFLKHG